MYSSKVYPYNWEGMPVTRGVCESTGNLWLYSKSLMKYLAGKSERKAAGRHDLDLLPSLSERYPSTEP